MTERDMERLGVAVDPEGGLRVVPKEQDETALPDETWEPERLASYVRRGLEESDSLWVQAVQSARKSAVQFFRAGRALHFAAKILKAQGKGKYGDWLEKNGIDRHRAWEARTLFERAKHEENVAGLSRQKAIDKYVCPDRGAGDKDLACEGPEPGTSPDSGGRTHEEAPTTATCSLAEGDDEEPDELNLADEPSSGEALDPGGPELGEPDLPEPDQEFSLIVLINSVSRLAYLEEEMSRIGQFDEEQESKFLCEIDRGIETLNRMRERLVRHAN